MGGAAASRPAASPLPTANIPPPGQDRKVLVFQPDDFRADAHVGVPTHPVRFGRDREGRVGFLLAQAPPQLSRLRTQAIHGGLQFAAVTPAEAFVAAQAGAQNGATPVAAWAEEPAPFAAEVAGRRDDVDLLSVYTD